MPLFIVPSNNSAALQSLLLNIDNKLNSIIELLSKNNPSPSEEIIDDPDFNAILDDAFNNDKPDVQPDEELDNMLDDVFNGQDDNVNPDEDLDDLLNEVFNP